MTLSLAFLDVTAIEEVAVDVWAEVFDATGWPTSIAAKKGSIDHADIVDAFQKDHLSDELLHALETLHELGSDAGRDAIVEAMNDRHIPLDTISQNSGEKEFSLRSTSRREKTLRLLMCLRGRKFKCRKAEIKSATTIFSAKTQGALQTSPPR